MVTGSERFLEVLCAIPSDFEQTSSKPCFASVLQSIKPLTNSVRDGFSHAFARQTCQLFHEPVSILILNVESHLIRPDVYQLYPIT